VSPTADRPGPAAARAPARPAGRRLANARRRPAAIDGVLAALAEPSRRAAVDLLRRGPVPAGELAGRLGLSAPAMSRHLRVLRRSGLVAEEHQGADARVRWYRLRPEPFAALRGWVEEVEAFWLAELESFKTYAERTRGRRTIRLEEP
jgi:DNA-binding transcriptional ArsR family regulator